MNKKNLANAQLDAALSTSSTSVVIKSGEGDRFPMVPFWATITPVGVLSSPDNSEIVRVTAVSGDTLTVVRAQRDTTAKSFSPGSIISNGIYTEDLEAAVQESKAYTDSEVLALDSSLSTVAKTGSYDDLTGTDNVVESVGTSADNALARFDGATGKLVQNSGVTLTDQDTLDSVSAVKFDTAGGVTPTAGSLSYNATEGVLDMGTGFTGTTIQLGMENVVRVRNSTGATIANGAVVYVNGAQGNRPSVALADADVQAQAMAVIGVATHNIANNSDGLITTEGIVRDLNTSAYSEGDVLYLSGTPGQFTTTPPVSPQTRVNVAVVTMVHNTQGEILVRPHVIVQKDDIGLGNVDNTSDANKPVSTAQQSALDGKLNKSGDTMSGNLNFATAIGTRFFAQTGNSSITKNTVYQTLDDFSRAWEVWLDKNGRNQAGIGWHGVNSDDGITHNAWEVKTSVSPSNADPGIMQTRIGIQSDKDKADFVMNYLGALRLYKGDGSNTQTWNVIADTGSIEQLGEFKSKDEQGTSYITVYKKPTAGSMVQSAEATGSATLDFEATPLDGTSSGIVRLFRNTNTTNNGTAFAVYNATNANILQHYFSAKSNSYVNAFGGNLGVGSTSPTAKLDVSGDTIRLRTSKTPSSATAAGNAGDIAWDANYMYVCVASNTWKRTPLSTW